jgi:hypothetical protein
MKKLFLISILFVMMLLTLLLGCQRNQTAVNASEDEFLKDSCIILTFADSTQCRYEIFRDNFREIQMEQSIQSILIADVEKHGLVIASDVTADVIPWFEMGQTLNINDSITKTNFVFTSTNFIKDLSSRKIKAVNVLTQDVIQIPDSSKSLIFHVSVDGTTYKKELMLPDNFNTVKIIAGGVVVGTITR